MHAQRSGGPGETAGERDPQQEHFLTPQELLAGSLLHYDVAVPDAVLRPASENGAASGGRVRLRPLKVGALTLIARASRDDPSLAPWLMVKEAMLEPAMTLDQVKQMHAGLVNFLITTINRISGLEPQTSTASDAAASTIGDAHLQLAWHFGWTPAQVAELTPGQVAIYLAGIERMRVAGHAPGSGK